MAIPRHLLVQRLQAIAQNGLTFATDPYDVERYQEIRAIAAEIAAEQNGLALDVFQAIFAAEHGYATPKVDVRAAVFQDGRILLVREKADGGWTLPGGWADVGDSPAEAVAREVSEESGYQVRVAKLLAVYDRNRHGHPPHLFHIYKLFFHCEIVGGAAATSAETTDVGFFAEDAIPELSTSRVTRTQIARLFEHARHPEWPTDFD